MTPRYFLGCIVHAYDPSSKVKMDPESLKYDNLHYHRIGIGKAEGETSILVDNKEEFINISTLENILKKNGDDKKHITYLKVDVEGQEVWSFKNWISSNALKYVDQLGIEMHTCYNIIGKSKMKEFKNLLKFMQHILINYKLQLIQYNSNKCIGKIQDSQRLYYSYHDALFVK